MINDERIKNENLQYDINREAAEISALSSSKIDKYEYLSATSPSNQSRIIEQAKISYFLSRESIWKIDEDNWILRKKTSKTVKSLDFSNKMNELEKI